MREQFDGKHGEEIKSEEKIREEAIEALQEEIEKNVTEEELENALKIAKENEESRP